MNDFFLTHGSYLVITVVLILTGSGLPIPEEVPIIAAGILSAPPDAKLDPFIALACCLFGALVGDCIMYWIGYHFGRGVLREHRWWARCVTPAREERIEEMFQRHGFKVFFVARFLVGLRTPVYLTAGILRVSFKKFVLIDLFCATAVVGSFFGLAYFFGENISQWSKWIKRGEWGLTIIVVIAVACAAFFLWRRYRRKKMLPAAAKRLEDVLLPPAKKEPTSGEVEVKEPLASKGNEDGKQSRSDHGDGGESNACQRKGEESRLGKSEKRPV
jgi:membrane protein DedA with SNARE-associated domain